MVQLGLVWFGITFIFNEVRSNKARFGEVWFGSVWQGNHAHIRYGFARLSWVG